MSIIGERFDQETLKGIAPSKCGSIIRVSITGLHVLELITNTVKPCVVGGILRSMA